MARSRKDNKGRVLRKGESQRKSDLMYIYTYTDDISRKRRYIYATDLLKLREKEKKIIQNQVVGLDGYAAGKMDLNQMFDRYIATKIELRDSTRYNYIYMYNHYVRNSFGRKKLDTIRYSDVLRFYLQLLKENELTIGTLQTINTVLHPVFQMAVRDNLIHANPTDDVIAQIKKKTKQSVGVRRALTVEQQRAFMNYIENSPFFCHLTPIFTVMLGTGCRVGEVTGLRWCDVDLQKRIISINHTMLYHYKSPNDKKMIYKVSQPKTKAGVRTIPMIEEVYEAFIQEAERQRETRNYCKVEVDGMKGFVFCNSRGGLYNSSHLNHLIRSIVKCYNTEEMQMAGQEGRQPVLLPAFSCHHLRHTFCARYCENETNVKVIQSVMGHSDFATTMDIYSEITETKKKESIENLSHNMRIF